MLSLSSSKIIFDFALTHALTYSYYNLTQRHVHVHASETTAQQHRLRGWFQHPGIQGGVASRLVHPQLCLPCCASVSRFPAGLRAASSYWWSSRHRRGCERGAFHRGTACEHHLDRLLFRQILQCPVQELRHEAQAASVVEELSKK